MSKLRIIRLQEAELAAEVRVIFKNKGHPNFEQGMQYARRFATKSLQVIRVESPVVMDDTTARRVAEKLLYSLWAARVKFEFKLGPKYSYLEPTDVISILDKSTGVTWDMMLTKKTETAEGICEFEAEQTIPSNFVQSITTGSVEAFVQSVNGTSVAPYSHFDDGPMYQDTDSEYGFYWWASSGSPGYRGSVLFQSANGGSSWDSLGANTRNATFGFVTGVLGNYTGNTIDPAAFTVNLINGSLASISQDEMNAGGNAALLGREVLQFKDAFQNADGSWTCATLFRGRRGTEFAINEHYMGERFILLSDLKTKRQVQQLSDANTTTLYKIVPFGGNINDIDPMVFYTRMKSKWPLSPAHTYAVKQPNGDYRIQWVRRTRVGGALTEQAIPVSESVLAFQIEMCTLQKTISAVDVSSDITVITTSTAHGYSTGQLVHFFGLKGLRELDDLTLAITVLTTTTFSIPVDARDFQRWENGGFCVRVVVTYNNLPDSPYLYTVAAQTTDFGSGQATLDAFVHQLSGETGRGFSSRATQVG